MTLSLQRALKVMRRDYTELHQAADWLEQLTAILDPEGKPNGKLPRPDRGGESVFATVDRVQHKDG